MCLPLCSASLPSEQLLFGGLEAQWTSSGPMTNEPNGHSLAHSCVWQIRIHLGQGLELEVLWRTGQACCPFCDSWAPGAAPRLSPPQSPVSNVGIVIPSPSRGGHDSSLPRGLFQFRPVISECLLPHKQLPSNPANVFQLSLCSEMVRGHTTWIQYLVG